MNFHVCCYVVFFLKTILSTALLIVMRKKNTQLHIQSLGYAFFHPNHEISSVSPTWLTQLKIREKYLSLELHYTLYTCEWVLENLMICTCWCINIYQEGAYIYIFIFTVFTASTSICRVPLQHSPRPLRKYIVKQGSTFYFSWEVGCL